MLAQIDRLQRHLADLAALLTAGDDARLRELAASTAARSQFLSSTELTGKGDWRGNVARPRNLPVTSLPVTNSS